MNFDSAVRDLLSDRITVAFADGLGRLVSGEHPAARAYAVLGPVPLPVTVRDRLMKFSWYTFAACPDGANWEDVSPEVLIHRLAASDDLASSVLVMGDLAGAENPLVRFHSCCATGDIFGSQRCECGPQLHRAMQMIADEGVGAIVYLADHEGRGIGLFAKAAAYMLQDEGFDTYEANRLLGFPDDGRNFSGAAFVLNFLRGESRPIRMISNNPQKQRSLEAGGIAVSRQIPLFTGLTRHNQRYLRSKRAYGHLFDESLLERVDSDPDEEERGLSGLTTHPVAV